MLEEQLAFTILQESFNQCTAAHKNIGTRFIEAGRGDATSSSADDSVSHACHVRIELFAPTYGGATRQAPNLCRIL